MALKLRMNAVHFCLVKGLHTSDILCRHLVNRHLRQIVALCRIVCPKFPLYQVSVLIQAFPDNGHVIREVNLRGRIRHGPHAPCRQHRGRHIHILNRHLINKGRLIHFTRSQHIRRRTVGKSVLLLSRSAFSARIRHALIDLIFDTHPVPELLLRPVAHQASGLPAGIHRLIFGGVLICEKLDVGQSSADLIPEIVVLRRKLHGIPLDLTVLVGVIRIRSHRRICRIRGLGNPACLIGSLKFIRRHSLVLLRSLPRLQVRIVIACRHVKHPFLPQAYIVIVEISIGSCRTLGIGQSPDSVKHEIGQIEGAVARGIPVA